MNRFFQFEVGGSVNRKGHVLYSEIAGWSYGTIGTGWIYLKNAPAIAASSASCRELEIYFGTDDYTMETIESERTELA